MIRLGKVQRPFRVSLLVGPADEATPMKAKSLVPLQEGFGAPWLKTVIVVVLTVGCVGWRRLPTAGAYCLKSVSCA
jgi:hypothetical protein